jgi:maltooligosyltrehalose trehalohydrolase
MIGANLQQNGKCMFTVWAPEKDAMVLHIVAPEEQKIEMQQDKWGYWTAEVEGVTTEHKYYYCPSNGTDFPDPVSYHQPEGVHGPSQVVDHSAYQWQDVAWRGLPLRDYVLYELHVGTFTEEGTFEAIIPRLQELKELGITAIEIMPVAQFPGGRNWGYDGVQPYAVQNTYGGPEGFKKLVEACHQQGMAVVLDVVYNHLGPEGNYLGKYAPYFTTKYHTPWGDAINFDGEWSDGVKEYFCNNIIYWFEHYHIDGLRLDAIHAIYDDSAVSFWDLVHEQVKLAEERLGRKLHLIAESDLNSPKVIKTPDVGGYGFSAQWLDDFHHAVYVYLNKNDKERYADFYSIEQAAKAYTDGFVHSGEYVQFRKKRYGASSAGVDGDRFIAFIQNHDQVGNMVRGERICMLVTFEIQKLAAATYLLAPYIPMLFMGEEYADESPFYYFVSHTEKSLIEAVREGRKKEFEKFKWGAEPPDAQSESTFIDSKLKWERRYSGKHKVMLEWYKHLIQLRKTLPALQSFRKNDVCCDVLGLEALALHRRSEDEQQEIICVFNFSEGEGLEYTPPSDRKWEVLLDSTDEQWAEPGTTAAKGKGSSIAPCSVRAYVCNK